MSAAEESVEYPTCDCCARGDYPIVQVDGDASVCLDCVDFHERALDAASAAMVEAFKGGTAAMREYAAVAVKAYLEFTDEPGRGGEA